MMVNTTPLGDPGHQVLRSNLAEWVNISVTRQSLYQVFSQWWPQGGLIEENVPQHLLSHQDHAIWHFWTGLNQVIKNIKFVNLKIIWQEIATLSK